MSSVGICDGAPRMNSVRAGAVLVTCVPPTNSPPLSPSLLNMALGIGSGRLEPDMVAVVVWLVALIIIYLKGLCRSLGPGTFMGAVLLWWWGNTGG
jgi:hypothetical protein